MLLVILSALRLIMGGKSLVLNIINIHTHIYSLSSYNYQEKFSLFILIISYNYCR